MASLLQKRKVNPEAISSSKSSDQITDKHDKLSAESKSLIQSLVSGYKSTTSSECKSIDAFLLFTMMTGVAQAIYCLLTKRFPYNAFIGVFSASVGSFVFAANARLKLSKKSELSNVEKAHLIIEFLVCSILLNIFVANFIG